MTRQRLLFFTAAGLSGVLAAGCSSTPPPGDRGPSPVVVSTRTIAAADRPDSVDASGVVQARTTAALTARLVAPVIELRVRAGDRVLAGDVLVVLDGRDLAAAARRAAGSADAARQAVAAASAEQRATDAAQRLAQITHARVEALVARRSATEQELDEAKAALGVADARAAGAAARVLEATAALESAQAETDRAGAAESFTRIAAPFAGVVTETRIETGNMAMPGTPLVVLEDQGGFRLDVRVDESRTGGLITGTQLSIVLDAAPNTGATLTGTVAEVARAVDAASHTALVKIALPHAPWLRSGMFGRVSWPGPTRRQIVVPPGALIRRGQVASVFVVEHGVARLRMLNVAGDEALAGLRDGDVVVVDAPADLRDGQPVQAGTRP